MPSSPEHLRFIQRPGPIADATTALAATALLAGEAEFQPLETFCKARCPETATACAAAYVAAFGHPQGIALDAQPFVSLLSTEAFYSSPRGQQVLLQSTQRLSGANRADSPIQRALRQIDACMADAILQSPR